MLPVLNVEQTALQQMMADLLVLKQGLENNLLLIEEIPQTEPSTTTTGLDMKKLALDSARENIASISAVYTQGTQLLENPEGVYHRFTEPEQEAGGCLDPDEETGKHGPEQETGEQYPEQETGEQYPEQETGEQDPEQLTEQEPERRIREKGRRKDVKFERLEDDDLKMDIQGPGTLLQDPGTLLQGDELMETQPESANGSNKIKGNQKGKLRYFQRMFDYFRFLFV